MTKNTRNTVLAAAASIITLFSFADDTPLVQALKTRDKIEEIREAIARRGVECASFDDMPRAIGQISYVNEFLNGAYKGPITLNHTTFSNTGFKNLAGKFDVYAPNLTSINSEIFYPAPGIVSFSGPKVTTVNSSGFRGSSKLRSVDLPLCTTLYDYAFADCASLVDINIPNVSWASGNYIFSGCRSLKTVNWQPFDSVLQYMFLNCSSLTNVPLSKSSVRFYGYCFQNCTSLDIKDSDWPDTATFSDGYQFQNCRSLKSINGLLSKFTTIEGDIASSYQGYNFQNCTSLTDIHSDTIVTLNSGHLFDGCASVTNVSFPNLKDVCTLNQNVGYMFCNMTSLKRIDMPKLETICKNMTRTSWSVLAGLKSLEEVEFPSLKYIGNMEIHYDGPGNLFMNCYNLRSARFPALTELQIFGNTDGHGMFSYCYNLEDLQMPALKFFRDSGAEGRYNSFIAHNYELKHVSFPSLEQIWGRSERMFYHCVGLKSVSLPKLTYINNGNNKNTTKGMANMFYMCPALTDVTTGMKGSELLAYSGFPGGAGANTVFHCPAEAPHKVDIMNINGTWKVITNGTFKLTEYIKSTGSQIVNTGYTHKTNTEVVIDFALSPRTDGSNYKLEYMWGANNGNNANNSFGAYTRWNNVDKFIYIRNSENVGSAYDLEGEEKHYKMVCRTDTCTIYNALGETLQVITATGTPDEGTCPIAVFNCNRTTDVGGFSPYGGGSGSSAYGGARNLKLFRFTIKEDDVPVVDLFPGRLGDDGVPCLLDACNNWHPMLNAGSGQFICGAVTNDVPVSAGN